MGRGGDGPRARAGRCGSAPVTVHWSGRATLGRLLPTSLPPHRQPLLLHPCHLAQALQARFVDYVKARKTVGLDELAAEFRMKTAEVVKRVQALEAEGALTGIMDDRGKVQM